MVEITVMMGLREKPPKPLDLRGQLVHVVDERAVNQAATVTNKTR
jgi:hypothetical protein